ncbi:hypothetical protein EYF80_034778 [Liparis tanakae]|uniref:Uncharacterized protein n=1 Tax=Liparis tanakae TaxID=230148 RepID=A0A4Z2GNY2_9TELE|nr:hypothetical protein EYF80_034778 [Liparis tanakae]
MNVTSSRLDLFDTFFSILAAVFSAPFTFFSFFLPMAAAVHRQLSLNVGGSVSAVYTEDGATHETQTNPRAEHRRLSSRRVRCTSCNSTGLRVEGRTEEHRADRRHREGRADDPYASSRRGITPV